MELLDDEIEKIEKEHVVSSKKLLESVDLLLNKLSSVENDLVNSEDYSNSLKLLCSVVDSCSEAKLPDKMAGDRRKYHAAVSKLGKALDKEMNTELVNDNAGVTEELSKNSTL